MMLVLAIVVLLGMGMSRGYAQVGQGSRRLIHFFDFEERDEGNYEKMPRYWFETGRRAQIADEYFHKQPLHAEMMGQLNFPIFNEMGFDQKHKISGDHSFAMRIKDGNVGAFLQVGAIPVGA